jgi:hypothetical protein
MDNLTLPISAIATDNSSAYFTVTVTSSVTADRFLDVIFVDTEGQLTLINVPSGSGYISYWVDAPDPTQDIGLVLGSTFDRSSAVSVSGLGTGALPSLIMSGGPMVVDPGINPLLVYAVEGLPGVAASYTPRYWVDDPGHP